MEQNDIKTVVARGRGSGARVPADEVGQNRVKTAVQTHVITVSMWWHSNTLPAFYCHYDRFYTSATQL